MALVWIWPFLKGATFSQGTQFLKKQLHLSELAFRLMSDAKRYINSLQLGYFLVFFFKLYSGS